MNRRTFFKGIGAALGVAVLGKPTVLRWLQHRMAVKVALIEALGAEAAACRACADSYRELTEALAEANRVTRFLFGDAFLPKGMAGFRKN